MSEYKELSCLAYDLRKKVVEMVVSGKGGHIGGDMSVIDVLVALYFKEMNISPKNMDDPDRDRFVMSKGHSVEAYYAVLAAKGFFPMEEVIEKFSKFGSPYIGHPNNKLPGIEMNSGSLGHGLPVCVGMALAGKMDKKDYRVYTVMGDGELAEGCLGGRNVRRKLQAGQPLCDRRPQPSADLRKYRGCHETGQPGGEMGSVRMECSFRTGQRYGRARSCV